MMSFVAEINKTEEHQRKTAQTAFLFFMQFVF
jgi:hypothetical protein